MWIGCFLVIVLLLFASINIHQGLSFLPRMQSDKVFFDQGKACLEVYKIASLECLGHLFKEKGEYVREQAAALERLSWLKQFSISDDMEFVTESNGEYGAIEHLSIKASGWAVLDGCRAPHRIVLTYGPERSLLALTVTGIKRDDINQAHDSCTDCVGWKVSLNEEILRERVKGQKIEAWAYDNKARTLIKLPRTF